MMTRYQWITRGMDGQVVDIDLCAVKMVMDALRVMDQRSCLVKVQNVFHKILNEEGR